MKRNSKALRKQRGFTLVEMSVSMAAAGLLFAAVTSGQELVDQAKATKLINDIKTIESQIQQYAQVRGHLPGDCDADGVIDFNAGKVTRVDKDNNARAGLYSYSPLAPAFPADGGDAALENNACAMTGAATTGATGTTSNYGVATNDINANVWLNDLKLAGVISETTSNRKAAKMVNEDFLFVGKVVEGTTGASAVEASYNAIVLHGVPIWMARRVANAINGQDVETSRSRVRVLTSSDSATTSTYTARFETTDATSAGGSVRDAMVSLVYYFDRVPDSTTVPL